ncbi:DUF2147 domain-containing protein [Devosia oryziradicis]|uniref:DUF2147 domain-containing protein n=1 Tax=Devosia oryziradicis TaxID=2801335 RepID=A0ABX7BU08_9HYPH|nr:DUF2147 domain-containing protein [Devosia oryziradicis]QQR35450.1 DUF2147 domain-containing protein [Devosia oryziradicis]
MANGRWKLGKVAALLLLAAPATAQEAAIDPNRIPDLIEGIWQTQELSEVTIALCPEGFCGTLSKIVVPREGLTEEEYAAAQAMAVESFTDVRNPDPALRSRPMLGLQILTLLPSTKPNIYDGQIYNPQDGNIYSGYVEMIGPDQMRLNGCVLYNLICQGQDWVRVIPEPVQGQ